MYNKWFQICLLSLCLGVMLSCDKREKEENKVTPFKVEKVSSTEMQYVIKAYVLPSKDEFSVVFRDNKTFYVTAVNNPINSEIITLQTNEKLYKTLAYNYGDGYTITAPKKQTRVYTDIKAFRVYEVNEQGKKEDVSASFLVSYTTCQFYVKNRTGELNVRVTKPLVQMQSEDYKYLTLWQSIDFELIDKEKIFQNIAVEVEVGNSKYILGEPKSAIEV